MATGAQSEAAFYRAEGLLDDRGHYVNIAREEVELTAPIFAPECRRRPIHICLKGEG